MAGCRADAFGEPGRPGEALHDFVGGVAVHPPAIGTYEMGPLTAGRSRVSPLLPTLQSNDAVTSEGGTAKAVPLPSLAVEGSCSAGLLEADDPQCGVRQIEVVGGKSFIDRTGTTCLVNCARTRTEVGLRLVSGS